ncbi:MAG: UDP-4-amino-4,6-dideoxy-N-acetyl-beta-L-altrosamine transaminase [Candidatus Riflebacteria bacterium]|nr:UDP-4-amino-4,6-dideoxy-N-acetyl-beta-L-altrosamine transaminase [Candidatus Riflebacteria bacterium]MDD3001039.1 UDP-4-amino-4,6-dideoxy-N-acetyl-beta-L-altrosamine transaminase [Candidatus Riflebacteria bacterium]
MKFIPYGRQEITQADIDAVVEVLKSDFLTQGPAIESFEQAVCDYVGKRHAVACCNGTAALHLAALAAGVAPGDICIVPAITFAASANCISYCGGKVVFADVDDTVTASYDSCRAILEKYRAEKHPVKAVVTVDMAGNCCDRKAFKRLKEEFGFVWISDSCHRIVPEKDCGGPDMTVYSFHPVKHITTGEGGMVVTDSDELAENLRLNRTHGITKDHKRFVNNSEAHDKNGEINPWYYEMQTLGFNYRITDFQAALGASQLKRLDRSVLRRQQIVEIYKKHLGECKNIAFPKVSESGIHAYHLAIVLIDFEKIGKTRAAVMKYLRENSIGTQVHYIPVPILPYYAEKANLGELPNFETPNSMCYYKKALSLPCFPTMSDDDALWVCEHLKRICE